MKAHRPMYPRHGSLSNLELPFFFSSQVDLVNTKMSIQGALFYFLGRSVYRTKDARREMQGAQEVGEDEETQVDLPIDQVFEM